jgi:hypothetical protein
MSLFLFADPRPIELVSPHSRSACVSKLRASTEQEWNILGKGEVVGRVGEDGLVLFMRRASDNAFKTILAATLTDYFGQTRLRCRFRVPHATAVILTLWIFGIVLVGGTCLVTFLVKAATSQSLYDVGIAFLPLSVGVVGLALAWMLRLFARNDRELLLEFLQSTIDGRRSEP